MNAENFDRKFDAGQEDIIEDLDLSTARRVNQEHKRINVWMVERLKAEAGGRSRGF